MDASFFYSLLRFEEASTALRAVLRLELVDMMQDKAWSKEELQSSLRFTEQGTAIFLALLRPMRILQRSGEQYVATNLAKACLSTSSQQSRQPYLAMGGPETSDALIAALRGEFAPENLPLYGRDAEPSLMESASTEAIAREVAFGLASRARCFAPVLADVIAEQAHERSQILADLGAGSPYVAHECLSRMPTLERAVLADRAAGLKFAKEMMQALPDTGGRIELLECNVFSSLPPADVYCVSNTAHDWLPSEYASLAEKMKTTLREGGLVVIHEPLMLDDWEEDDWQEDEWPEALWMACYALTLYKLTAGQGTCYTLEQHDSIMIAAGFERIAAPRKTVDGCTALCYRISK